MICTEKMDSKKVTTAHTTTSSPGWFVLVLRDYKALHVLCKVELKDCSTLQRR